MPRWRFGAAGSGAGLLVMLLATAGPAAAAQDRPSAYVKPDIELVATVGCVAQRAGGVEWWLVNAAEPDTARSGVFDVLEVEAARDRALGDHEFRLIGVPEFLGTEALLRSADRSLFTTPEQVNATGELRAGRTVLVKGLLIEADSEAESAARINLLAVVGLADACGEARDDSP